MLPLHLQDIGLDLSRPIRRLGRLATTADQRRRKIAFRRMADQFPAPPEACLWNQGIADTAWGMMLNDQLGDCGPAAIGHRKMSRSSAKGAVVTPADSDVLALYEAAGGYVPGKPWTDGGVNNPTMIGLLMQQGFTVNGTVDKVDATATVEAGDIDALKKAIYHLGGTLFGIQLSQTCYTNFGPGNVWDADNSRIVGGHDVWGCGYNATGPLIVTWGALTQCTWAWAAKFADDIDILQEVADWTAGGSVPDGLNGLNIAQWLADSQALLGAQPPAPVPTPVPSPVPVPGPTHRGLAIAHALAEWHKTHPGQTVEFLGLLERHPIVAAALAEFHAGSAAKTM